MGGMDLERLLGPRARRKRRERAMLGMLNLAALAIALAALAVALMCCGGCCNFIERTEKPYALAPSAYYCTAAVGEALTAPFADDSPDGIAAAFFTLTWPLWLVDLPCEAALDTVFLPADAIAAEVRKNNQPKGENP